MSKCLLVLFLVFLVAPVTAGELNFNKHDVRFTYRDTYRIKIQEKKAVRIIADGPEARIGVTIINRVVPRSLDHFVVESMKKELAGKGMKQVSHRGKSKVFLPFRNVQGTGSAYRARYKRGERFITAYIYIFSRGGKTYLVSLTDKLGSSNTFDLFLNTFRVGPVSKKK